MKKEGSKAPISSQRILPNVVHQATPTSCFRACVASVLGLSFHDVPEACDGDKWDWDGFQLWLSRRGLQAIEITFGSGGTIYPVQEPVLCIVTGNSPRECVTGRHAVVAQLLGLEGFRLLHDPHPSETWIDGDPTHAVFFVSTNPNWPGDKRLRPLYANLHTLDEQSLVALSERMATMSDIEVRTYCMELVKRTEDRLQVGRAISEACHALLGSTGRGKISSEDLSFTINATSTEMTTVEKGEQKVKHTPGPWIVCINSEDESLSIEQDLEELGEDDGDAVIVVDCVADMGDGLDREIGIANARLIAASPKLCSLLRALLDWCREHTSPTQKNSPHKLLVEAHHTLAEVDGGSI